jgi:hypothetical protein
MSNSEVEIWWNSVRDNAYWSGAIVGFRWDELGPQDQDELKKIAEMAVETCERMP